MLPPLMLVCALPAEARALIDHYQLVKEENSGPFSIFCNQNVSCVVSGVGKVRSAMATTALLQHSNIGPKLVVNCGFAGSTTQSLSLGEAVVINQVIDDDTGRQFYPDMLLKNDLKEAALKTFSQPVTTETDLEGHEGCVDMEGSGFWEAAQSYASGHELMCLKIISDYLEPAAFDHKATLAEWLEAAMPQCLTVIEHSRQSLGSSEFQFSDDEQTEIDKVVHHGRLSISQQHELRRLCQSFKIRNSHLKPLGHALAATKAQTKSEGKEFFEMVKKDLQG